METRRPTKSRAGARDAHDARNAVAVHPAGEIHRFGSARADFMEKNVPVSAISRSHEASRAITVPVSALVSAETGTSPCRNRSAWERAKTYPFLRAAEWRAVPVSAGAHSTGPESMRTRFCESKPGLAVPVSAWPFAETGTANLQASPPSLWLIRLFTRRNRYGDPIAGHQDIGKPHPPVRLSAMKVHNSAVEGEGLSLCSSPRLANRHAETGTHGLKADSP